jgi:hypothetical protein
MTDDRLQLGINDELRRAMGGFDVCAGAMLADYARLKLLAGEPLDPLLKAYAPTGYEQTEKP